MDGPLQEISNERLHQSDTIAVHHSALYSLVSNSLLENRSYLPSASTLIALKAGREEEDLSIAGMSLIFHTNSCMKLHIVSGGFSRL